MNYAELCEKIAERYGVDGIDELFDKYGYNDVTKMLARALTNDDGLDNIACVEIDRTSDLGCMVYITDPLPDLSMKEIVDYIGGSLCGSRLEMCDDTAYCCIAEPNEDDEQYDVQIAAVKSELGVLFDIVEV